MTVDSTSWVSSVFLCLQQDEPFFNQEKESERDLSWGSSFLPKADHVFGVAMLDCNSNVQRVRDLKDSSMCPLEHKKRVKYISPHPRQESTSVKKG